VRELADRGWTGTASELLTLLTDRVPELQRGRDWPSSPRALSCRLRRIAPDLRRLGVAMEFDLKSPARNRDRLLSISAVLSADDRYAAEERAAIREYDGGLPRDEAERAVGECAA
jgi:hypothetical protein